MKWQRYAINEWGCFTEIPQLITQEEALKLAKTFFQNDDISHWLKVVEIQVAAGRSGVLGKATGLQLSYAPGG